MYFDDEPTATPTVGGDDQQAPAEEAAPKTAPEAPAEEAAPEAPAAEETPAA